MPDAKAHTALELLLRKHHESGQAIERLRNTITNPGAIEKLEKLLQGQKAATEELNKALARPPAIDKVRRALENHEEALRRLAKVLAEPKTFTHLKTSLAKSQGAEDQFRQLASVQSATSRLQRALENQQRALDALGQEFGISTQSTRPREHRKRKSAYVVRSAEGGLDPVPGEEVTVPWELEDRPAQLIAISGPPHRRQATVEFEDGETLRLPLDAVRSR